MNWPAALVVCVALLAITLLALVWIGQKKRR